MLTYLMRLSIHLRWMAGLAAKVNAIAVDMGVARQTAEAAIDTAAFAPVLTSQQWTG